MTTWLAIIVGFSIVAAVQLVVGIIGSIAIERYCRRYDYKLEQLTEAAWALVRGLEARRSARPRRRK